MADLIDHPWKWALSATLLAVSILVSAHALVRKRDPRSALWWVSINLLLPLVGPVLYYFFGVNRIERKAIRLRRRDAAIRPLPRRHTPLEEPAELPPERRHLARLSHILDSIVKSPLVVGNSVTPLVNGEHAYPMMMAAIDNAEHSIGLSTYIFEQDHVGRKFVESLSRAVHRGVQVRVLVDDVGSGFFWKSVLPFLRSQKIPTAAFLPTLTPWRMAYLNLRNHRKILTVDGRLAFTGGMNISQNHMLSFPAGGPCQDLHFQIEGPVIAQIQNVFRGDWHFTTGELLEGPAWFPSLEGKGKVMARAIADGPDENIQKTRWAIMAALAHARQRVCIMTPYFIPDAGLITALQMASLNGVDIQILLPRTTDLMFVQWATRATLWQVLEHGCRVWETPPPFHHTKLMVVDGEWTLFGSTNWDVRSLRLNFEFNMECYDRDLADRMEKYFGEQQAKGREVTLAEVDSRSLPVKIRDGFARLFTPIL